MWPSDANRLEDAYRTGLEEVLVYGRKYVVNLKASVRHLSALPVVGRRDVGASTSGELLAPRVVDKRR